MYYYYHANALALGGKIRRPLEQVIESQAASVLPSSGGFGSSRVENFNFKHIVSFRVAHTEVAGSEIEDNDDPIHTARSSVIVEGLNILNVITADKVVARLASRHPADDDEPAIITTGSYFENLKIAGHAVEVVEFAHGTFHSLDTYERLQHAFDQKENEPADWQMLLGCHLGRQIPEPNANDPHPAEVEHLRQRYVQLQGADELPGTVLCSVIKQITLRPGSSEIKVYGPIVVVPRFGVIILGELICKHGTKRLHMIRVELGSPDAGTLLCSALDGNGVGG